MRISNIDLEDSLNLVTALELTLDRFSHVNQHVPKGIKTAINKFRKKLEAEENKRTNEVNS